MKNNTRMMKLAAVVLMSMAVVLDLYSSVGETEIFRMEAKGKSAVVYAEKLDVIPLEEGANEFAFPVKLRPIRDKSGNIVRKAKKPFVYFLPDRVVNIAPHALVATSSRGKRRKEFRPVPGLNEPSSLNDGIVRPERNFSFENRKTPPRAENPEWIILSWPKAITISGAMVFSGGECFTRSDKVVVESYTGTVDPRVDGNPSNWKAVSVKWSAVKCEGVRFGPVAACQFDADVKTAALRFKLTAGGWSYHEGPHEVPTPGLAEIAVFSPWSAPTAPVRSAREGFVGIPFEMPFDGKATIQVRDVKTGKVVANPVAGVSFAKGTQMAQWDLEDIRGKSILPPGEYEWRGIATPPLQLKYLHSYYPLGLPPDRRTWLTADDKGGWLADHDPPRGVCRDGTNMWLNAWAEHGHSVIETDINMKKLWGITRIWVAVPQEICVDGDFVYGYSQAGWNGTDEEIVRIHKKTKASKKVFLLKNPPEKKGGNPFWDVSVSGFQVLGDTAFVAHRSRNEICVYDISRGNRAKARMFTWATVHKQFDELKPVLVRTISVPSPGRLRKYGEGRLLTTMADGVATIDVSTFEVKLLFAKKFDTPLGVGIGDDGLIWVGEGGKTHQVAAYTADGREVCRLGKKGKREVGPWNPDDLEEPAGVEVDAQGRVWVAEHTHWEKRVSVWDPKTRSCVQDVLGPTQYGGDGCVDPEDTSRLFYRGLEMRRDAKTGKIRPVNMIFRPDSEKMQNFLTRKGGDYPSYCFRARGSLWFTSFMYPHAHSQLVLWRHTGDRVRPAAAMGSTRSVTNILDFAVSPEKDGRFYTWTDENDDGYIQRSEIRFGDVMYNGRPLPSVMARWTWRMNENFEAAGITDMGSRKDDPCRIVVFRPAGFTAAGTPRYDIPVRTIPAPTEVDSLMPDSRGNVIALGGPVQSVSPDGTVNWSYRNDWPGLHAGHHTTAAGNEPGVLIAPTRIWGMAQTAGDAGEVVSFNSNLGCSYLMTVEDGLYIDRIFRDARVAAAHWNFNDIPDSLSMMEASLQDEHFGGTFERVRGEDGKWHCLYVIGKGDCTVLELIGLDGIKRLKGGRFTVSAEDVGAAERRCAKEIMKKTQPKILEVAKGRPGKDAKSADGFRLGYDEKYLYVSAAYDDYAARFTNKGDNPFELFKTGDTLEVMLRTKAPNTKKGVQEGDIRLLFAPFNGKTVCVMYDYKVKGAKAEEKVAFSSPWRTFYVDRVSILNDVEIKVSYQGAKVFLDAKIPLKTIHFTPRGDVKGDVGRVSSDASGTRAAARIYWCNKNTAIMSDLPSEVMIQPDLWGIFRF